MPASSDFAFTNVFRQWAVLTANRSKYFLSQAAAAAFYEQKVQQGGAAMLCDVRTVAVRNAVQLMPSIPTEPEYEDDDELVIEDDGEDEE